MSTTPPSRGDILVSKTLADVATGVSQAELPDRRRQELKSALRTVARALGRRLEDVPADPRLLANRLAEVAPVAIGISPGRWANVKSLMRSAMSLVVEVGPSRHCSPLSPSWAALWDRLPTRTARTRLSRFMHFASAAEIEPSAMTTETFAAFRVYLDATLLKDPDRVYCATIDGWRAARPVIVGWPDVEIVRPNRHNLWALPLENFPESFQRDLEAWLNRLSGHDLMSDGPLRPVRPITRRSHAAQIRRFASAVVLSGRDITTITRLAELTTIDAFATGLTFLLKQRANKSSPHRAPAARPHAEKPCEAAASRRSAKCLRSPRPSGEVDGVGIARAPSIQGRPTRADRGCHRNPRDDVDADAQSGRTRPREAYEAVGTERRPAYRHWG